MLTDYQGVRSKSLNQSKFVSSLDCLYLLQVPCHSWGFYCYDKNTMTKNDLERKRFTPPYKLLGHTLSVRKIKAEAQRQELKKSWKNVAQWHALCGLHSTACLACFLITQDHLSRGVTASSGPAFPHQGMPIDLPTGQSPRGISLLKFPPPRKPTRIPPLLVKVKHNYNFI